MSELPLNDVTTFGAAESTTAENRLGFFDLIKAAPAPNPERDRPAVKRILSADGVNLILFTFAPGQDLPDHKAAHPITVQVLRGAVNFRCAETATLLRPGGIVHLPAYVPHSVDCPRELGDGALATDAPSDGTGTPTIMLLSMLTPQDS